MPLSLCSVEETEGDEAAAEEVVRQFLPKFFKANYSTNYPQKDLSSLVDSLQTASGVLELQQGGDKLIKRLKEIQNVKWKSIRSKIDMLKQESLEALEKVHIFQWLYVTENQDAILATPNIT